MVFRRLGVIVLAAILMAVIVLVIAPRLHGPAEIRSRPPAVEAERPIAAEAGMFQAIRGGSAVPLDTEAPSKRTLAGSAKLRAYPGAPPAIPHPLTPDEYRLQQCGTCHARGGWVSRLNAYAPVTPHPELSSCLQCHVPQEDAPLFRATRFEPVAAERGSAAFEGAPPPVPHSLQMRENCLACHGGPSAPKEIRTQHPERTACRQCHVGPAEEGAPEFVRPGGVDAGGGDK